MRIKNWKKLQHFNNRKPSWIKLYKDILDKRDVMGLSDCAFRVLIGCWLLAAEDPEMQGEIPDKDTIAFRLRMREEDITSSLGELSDFLISDGYQDDINMISNGYQDDINMISQSKSKSKRKRREEKENTIPVVSVSNAICHPEENAYPPEWEAFYKMYPGTKSKQSDWQKLRKHADWKNALPLLLAGLERELTAKDNMQAKGMFVPSMKNLSTWINNRCWEAEWVEGRSEESGIAERVKDFPADSPYFDIFPEHRQYCTHSVISIGNVPLAIEMQGGV